MEIKESLEGLSYPELEKLAEECVETLSDGELPLDEASKIYAYGKKILAKMDETLARLSKECKDEIRE